MDVVLGVSMALTAVRMVLVEGADGNGLTVDHHCATLSTGNAAEQVVAFILGTRDSAAEGGHRVTSTGVVWTDLVMAAELRRSLLANNIDDVVLVSRLQAASALAQAIGQALGCERTALMFLECDTATLAVVRAGDGAVTRVESRNLRADDAVAELRHMVAGLEQLADPPQAVFLVGSGIDVAALKPMIAAGTSLTVHAPEDAALALARGAALAAVGLTPNEDTSTVAGIITQRAAAAYMAPLGFSAVPEDDEPAQRYDADLPTVPEDSVQPERVPFLLVGSALMTIFVVGVLALVASLVITVRPTADPRTDPGENAAVSSTQLPAPGAQETIANPVPVVQEAPRTIYVTPRVAVPAAPAPEATFAPQAPVPAVPAPVPAVVPVAPAPVAPAPVIVGILPQLLPQLVPQLLPQIVAPPVRITPAPQSPTPTSTSVQTPVQTTSPAPTSAPTSAPISTTSSTTTRASTSAETDSSATESASGGSTVSSVIPTTPLLPATPTE